PWHLAEIRVEEPLYGGRGFAWLLLLARLFANSPAGQEEASKGSGQRRTTERMIVAGLLHHFPLRPGPVLLSRQQPNVEPFPPVRKLAILGFGMPGRRSFGQHQLGPAGGRFLLFAGQPGAERGDQVVVSELVVVSAGLVIAGGPPGGFKRRQGTWLIAHGLID